MEMIEKFHLETWKSILGSSILHYSSHFPPFLYLLETLKQRYKKERGLKWIKFTRNQRLALV